MLKTTVGWTLMFRVGNQDKARKELRRAEELLGLELSLGACERYWKIPELWTCDAETHIEASSAVEQVSVLAARQPAGNRLVCSRPAPSAEPGGLRRHLRSPSAGRKAVEPRVGTVPGTATVLYLSE